MKIYKSKNIWILIIGILVFLVAYRVDNTINLFFKNINNEFLDFILGIATNFGFLVFVALLVPSMIFYKKNKRIVYLLWLSFIISILFAFIAKLIFLRQRPNELVYPFLNIINYSFPSMHSTVVFSLLPILMKHMPKQRYFWLIFTIFVAFSRVYFGLHFLSDVVFGALVGYLIGNFLLDYEYKVWR